MGVSPCPGMKMIGISIPAALNSCCKSRPEAAHRAPYRTAHLSVPSAETLPCSEGIDLKSCGLNQPFGGPAKRRIVVDDKNDGICLIHRPYECRFEGEPRRLFLKRANALDVRCAASLVRRMTP